MSLILIKYSYNHIVECWFETKVFKRIDIVNPVVFGSISFWNKGTDFAFVTSPPSDDGSWLRLLPRRMNDNMIYLILNLHNFSTMRNIFISCGHNNARNLVKNENGQWVLGRYKDQGAVNPLNKEDTEYKFVRKVASSLNALWGPIDGKLLFVPEGLNLDQRISWINTRAVDGDICIELHMNSGGWTWVEVLAHGGSRYALNKAAELSSIMASSMGIRNRWAKSDSGTRFGSLGFIRKTKPLAFLIELGFIDNATDRDRVWMKWGASLKLALWTVQM